MKLKSIVNGKYVALSQEDKQPLSANQSSADNAEIFEVSDWGWNSHTLISGTNGLYLTTDDSKVTASSEHIWEWFTKEVFHVRRDNEAVTLTTWNDRPVTVDAVSGNLNVQDGSAKDADAFAFEKVVDGLNVAVETAREADVAVVFVGNHPLINGKETIDRPDLTLAASQERLIKEVYAANPNTIVVIVGSYPYAINWINEHIPAVLYCSHAGHEIGTALADVLFGHYNPAGRLNMTWYESVDQLGEFMDYDIIKSERTYQYFVGKPLYPFGHGLSYTAFQYDRLTLDSDRIAEGGRVTATLRLTNTGTSDGEEVVQLYTRSGPSRVKRPLRQLQGFKRIALAAGESAEVSFELNASDLVFWDVTREKYCLESGQCILMIGSSSSDIRLNSTITVDGETIPARNLLLNTKAVNYDAYEGVLIGENAEGGDSVATSSALSWIRFDDVALRSDISAFEARVLCSENARIEIRIDSPDGQLAGSCDVSGSPSGWQSVTCPAELPDGNRSVYFVFNGELVIGSFQFRS